MIEYGILMIFFGILIILFGFYIYKGHDNVIQRGYYRKRSKAYLKYVGKLTMLLSLPVFSSSLVAFIIKDASFLPFIFLIGGFVLVFVIYFKKYGDGENL